MPAGCRTTKTDNKTMTTVWCKLRNKILQTGEWPTDRLRSIFVAIPKIPGTTDCAEHRTIAPSAMPARYYYESCYNGCRRQQTNSLQMNKWGSAIRWERKTRFPTSGFKWKGARGFNVPLYMTFIDYKKALLILFSTQHSVLKRMEVNGTIVSLMKRLYSGRN